MLYINVEIESDIEIQINICVKYEKENKKNRQTRRSNNRNNEDSLGSCEQINLGFQV
jgi:hypothetical protein